MTESQSRLDRIRERLEQANVDALLVTNAFNRRYALRLHRLQWLAANHR